MPEETMPETEYSTGGEVEHEIFMVGGVLLFILELKLNNPTPDNLAQLFLEFLSAAKLNMNADFEGLRIYGLLTNLTQFKFYSYDPKNQEFCLDESTTVDNRRESFASNMIDITNKIFGLILSAFLDGLCTIAKKNNDRAAKKDFSPPSSNQIRGSKSVPKFQSQSRGKHGRKSPAMWELALKFGEECRDKFNEKATSIQDMERNAIEALDLLTQSVRCIPRFSDFTGTMDTPTSADLKTMARDIVEKKYQNLLKLSTELE